jgi:Fe-S-cluster containining protein
MAVADRSDEGDLPAGGFSTWLHAMQRALSTDVGSDVPCQGCTACCSSYQFVHIGPDETEALAHIPDALLFPAPRLPAGHVLLGYDEQGRCPMLAGDHCSIYEHRPRTCRTYDCRVFPAAGLEIEDDDKILIAERARRWRFDFPTDLDTTEGDAVRAAAALLHAHEDLLPKGSLPATTTAICVLAVQIHDAFLRRDTETGGVLVVIPDIDDLRHVLAERAAD